MTDVSAVVVGGVIVAVAGAIAVGGVKQIGRWLSKAMRREFADAVESVTAPKFEALDAKFDVVQKQNRDDHGVVAGRLEALETRQAEVEKRLAEVEKAVTIQTKG